MKTENNDIKSFGSKTLETIREETGLPRIQQLIPKSPETRKREQEFEKLCEKYANDKTIEQIYELVIMNKNIQRIYFSDKVLYSPKVNAIDENVRYKRNSCPPKVL